VAWGEVDPWRRLTIVGGGRDALVARARRDPVEIAGPARHDTWSAGASTSPLGHATVLTITPHNLHWLSVEAPQSDLCAHGGVVIACGDSVLIDQRSEQWTLSAAALMLLRTLTEDHTADHRVGEHLFPCCGHVMYERGGSDDVLIVGCPNGLDFEVRHRDREVEVQFKDQPPVAIPSHEWRAAVLSFSDAIKAFYACSSAKLPSDEVEAIGYEVFCAEWNRRSNDAGRAA